MKELRVTDITKKVSSVVEDENHVFAENFMKQSLEEHCHDERKLWKTSGGIQRSHR